MEGKEMHFHALGKRTKNAEPRMNKSLGSYVNN